MRLKFSFACLCMCLLITHIGALERLLDLPSRELFLSQGYPDDLTAMRGDRNIDDSILVQYNMGMSFVLHKNHVIQIRLDKRYRGTVLGLYMGMDYNEVASTLKLTNPNPSDPEIQTQITDSSGQVLIVRAFFYEKKLTDIYLQLKK